MVRIRVRVIVRASGKVRVKVKVKVRVRVRVSCRGAPWGAPYCNGTPGKRSVFGVRIRVRGEG